MEKFQFFTEDTYIWMKLEGDDKPIFKEMT